jgi:hypothetical protein
MVMMNILKIKSVMFLFAFLCIMSCSKTNTEPSIDAALLVGKWKDSGYVEKLTITDNGKTAIVDRSVKGTNDIIEFKADGKVDYYGAIFTYSIAGSILTFKSGNTSYNYTISKVDSKQLVLTFTKEQFYNYLPSIYNVKDVEYIDYQNKKPKITAFEYSESFVK